MKVGGVKLDSRIPEIQASIRLRVTRAVREGAELVAERAKERAPVGAPTVHLRDAIHVEKPPNTTYTYAVVAGDDTVFYGHLVEYGTEASEKRPWGTAPRPFLIPAAEESTDDVAGIVTAALQKL